MTNFIWECFIRNINNLMEDNEEISSVADLARKSGIAQPQLSNYLNRKSEPGFDAIISLAKTLNVLPSELLRDSSKPLVSPESMMKILEGLLVKFNFNDVDEDLLRRSIGLKGKLKDVPNDILDALENADQTQLNMVRGALGIKQQQKAKKKKEEAV